MIPVDEDYPEDVLLEGDGLAMRHHGKSACLAATNQRDALFDSLRATFDQCLETMRKKNADYTVENRAFGNFEMAPFVGVSIERGLLVRITDKMSRISTLLDRPAVVTDESLDDSIEDAISYLGILKAYRELVGR